MTVGERIKEIRIENKLSMEKFGEIIGVSRPSISKIESGVNNPSDQTRMLICKEFGINEEWLQNGTGEKYSKDLPIDSFTDLSVQIDKYDSRARNAIINYMKLSPEAKKFVMDYIDILINDPEALNEKIKNKID